MQLEGTGFVFGRGDPGPGKLTNDFGIAVHSTLRGTGLIASALGPVVAPQRCAAIISDLLSQKSVLQRSDHLIAAVSCGAVTNILPSGGFDMREATEARQNSKPQASWGSQKPELRRLDELGKVQTEVAAVQKKSPRRRGCIVISLDVLPLTHNPAQMTQYCDGPKVLAASCTQDGQREMSKLGGAYERLRTMLTASRLPDYKNGFALCLISQAHRFGIQDFDLPRDKFLVLQQEGETRAQALDGMQVELERIGLL